MRQTARAADTAADARHSLNKVCVKNVFALFEKCDFARLYAVAGARLEDKIRFAVFLQSFGNSVIAVISVLITFNAVIEWIACTVIGSAVSIALNKALKKRF